MKKLLSLFLIYIFLFPMLGGVVLADSPAAHFADNVVPAGAPGTSNAGSPAVQPNAPPTGTATAATAGPPGTGAANANPIPAPSGTSAPSSTLPQPQSSGRASQPAGQGVVNGVVQRNELVCDSSQLSSQETQNLIDLLKKGFTVKGEADSRKLHGFGPPAALKVGEAITIVVQVPELYRPRTFKAVVRRVTGVKNRKDLFRVGAELVELSEDARRDLRKLVERR